jgi:hypothetical protein
MRRLIVFLLIFLPFLGFSRIAPVRGGSEDPLTIVTTNSDVQSFLKTIQEHHFKSEKAKLHELFTQAHKIFLKRYQAYSEFPELFESGKYDCLTATVLFSSMLNELNFKYSMIETNYHIFIIVHATSGDILLETTDKFNGFVTDTQKIQERIGVYRQNLVANSGAGDKKVYHYSVNLYHEVSAEQLQGLLYFNQAVKSFNNSEWEKCAELLEKARGIYDSPRVAELTHILIQSVSANVSDESKKRQILSRLVGQLASESPRAAGL